MGTVGSALKRLAARYEGTLVEHRIEAACGYVANIKWSTEARIAAALWLAETLTERLKEEDERVGEVDE